VRDIRVLRERAFTSSDDEKARLAAIVSHRLAARL
jgi:hypothetical protein